MMLRDRPNPFWQQHFLTIANDYGNPAPIVRGRRRDSVSTQKTLPGGRRRNVHLIAQGNVP
jgi:hypothetical protein